jgi:hypothetical protein
MRAEPGRPVPPPRPVQLKTGTTVVQRPNQNGLRIQHKNADGSEIVLHTHVGPNGTSHLTGYRVTTDAAAGTKTRVYLNGSKVITGRDFVTRANPGGVSVTVRRDGLRECANREGKPVFREQFRMQPPRPGAPPERVIERTVYVHTVRGQPVYLPTPIVETYRPMPYHGVVVYSYAPRIWAPVFFAPFFVPFPRPIVVAPACFFCPSPIVVWERPVVRYTEPEYLVADMQISTGFDDGYNENAPPPGPDPAVLQLQQQVGQLQQEIDSEQADNEELRAQLADQQAQLAALQAQAAPGAPPPPPAPVQVPEDVHAQVRQQVKDDIALHQQQQPLALPDILAAPNALGYIFQVSDPLDTTDASTGEECSLTGGDLARLSTLPAESDPVAQLTVVTSKVGSCRAGTVISVSMADLQSMLNAFNQRLEQNLDTVHQQVAQK